MVDKYLFNIECEQCKINYLSVGFADQLSFGGEKTECPSCSCERYIKKNDQPIAKLEKIKKY
jgi:hypothetical protein